MVAMAVAMVIIEESVLDGISTPIFRREDAVATAEEIRVVGVAFSREVSAGSKPGGGSIRRSKSL